MGYGADEIYTQWSMRSLEQWKKLFAATGSQALFQRTGVLWLAEENHEQLRATREVLQRNGLLFDELDSSALVKQYPQINFDGIARAIYEPDSGVLLARRAVAVTVAEAVRMGVEFKIAGINEPEESSAIEAIETTAGEKIAAKQFVFACGAWLKKLFPAILGTRIFPTRQCVFYFGVPAGDSLFSAPALPTWLFKNDESYGMPDIESRGLKIALDRHGEMADPDTQSRIVTAKEVQEIRSYTGYRFPGLKDAPIVETRVCQYENTSSGDFLIDRHPQIRNVWFAGAVGARIQARPGGWGICGRAADGRRGGAEISVASKARPETRGILACAIKAALSEDWRNLFSPHRLSNMAGLWVSGSLSGFGSNSRFLWR